MHEITVEGNAFGTNSIKISGETLIEVHYVAPWIDNAKQAELTRRIVAMLENRDEEAVKQEREACAQLCADIGQKHRDAYKGRGETIDRSKYYDSRTDGMSDGAWECEEAIRARGESNGIA